MRNQTTGNKVNSNIRIIYIPAGVPTFHMETAGAAFESSKLLLKEAAAEAGLDDSCLIMPDEMLLGTDKLAHFLENALSETKAELVIFQNTTFANAAYIREVIKKAPDAHVLIWTLREPKGDGGRLRLNSLTGAYSAANTLKAAGNSLSYVLGSPYGEDAEKVKKQIASVMAASACRAGLIGARVATIGENPEGFEFGHADDRDLLDTFGIIQERVSLEEMFEKAVTYTSGISPDAPDAAGDARKTSIGDTAASACVSCDDSDAEPEGVPGASGRKADKPAGTSTCKADKPAGASACDAFGISAAHYLKDAEENFPGFKELPEANRKGYAALMKAYRDYASSHGIDAMASRCWPDCFTEYGTPVCTVLSVMNDLGVPAACETDTYGAVSMLIGSRLSGGPVFFGDPSAADPDENTITYWHCGMAAPSLACSAEGPCAGVHCNRGIGPTMEFGCRGGEAATIFRLGRDQSGAYRFFIGKGEALERPRQYHGTSLVVRWDSPVEEVIHRSVMDGWEPHFVVMYGDYAEELTDLAAMYGIPVLRY